jgi:hypothetical protein
MSELVVELCTQEDAMSDFINGLMPSDLRDAVNKEVAETKASQTARERSQASLMGHQQKQEAPKPTVQTVPEVPTVIENTADPVLEGTVTPVAPSAAMSTAELEALLAERRAS